MKKIASFIAIALISGSAHASFIEGDNYSNDVADAFWTNNDLGLDILRLEWADTLGTGLFGTQASFEDVTSFTQSNEDGWRWATASEFGALASWFDTDSTTAGWSTHQQEATELFFSLNGVGGKYFGTGPNGEVYNDGYDHHGYSYWQFNTLLENEYHYAWVADFNEECPSWSVLCESGSFAYNGHLGYTLGYTMADAEHNIAPLLVRSSGNTQTPVVNQIPEPMTILMMVAGIAGFVRYRRT